MEYPTRRLGTTLPVTEQAGVEKIGPWTVSCVPDGDGDGDCDVDRFTAL
jgi:hypothetical protein